MRKAHTYRVTFADGAFFDEESDQEFREYVGMLENLARQAPWLIPSNDQNIAFNMRTVVKVGVLR